MPELPRRVLLVEDNPADVCVIKAAFQRLDFELQVQFVPDGQMALDYLAGKRPFGDRTAYPLPHLILLDLGLPKVSGFEVLEWVRTHPDLRFIPIIILATSNLYADIQRAYAFGANSFITKPAELNKLVQDIKTAFQYWLPSPAGQLPIREQQSPAAGDQPSKSDVA